MLSRAEIERITELKAKGYSKGRVARELGVSKATVLKYWEGAKETSLEDLARLFRQAFYIQQCPACKFTVPMPRFLSKFLCPNCGQTLTRGGGSEAG